MTEINTNDYSGPDRRQEENAERRRRFKMACTEHCPDHSDRMVAINSLQNNFASFEEKYKEVPETIAGLSGRVRLLIWLIALMCTGTLTGVLYSFNAVHTFKDQYAQDKERSEEKVDKFMAEMRTTVFTIRDDMNKSNSELRKDITAQITDLGNKSDDRLDAIEKSLIELDGKIKLVEEKGKNGGS